jgi:hypothetical protein
MAHRNIAWLCRIAPVSVSPAQERTYSELRRSGMLETVAAN